MAVEEHESRIRRSIEEKLGVAEAAYVIGGRPPGGWASIVTKEYLDLRLEALEARLTARLGGRIDGLEGSLGRLEGRLDGLDGRVEGLAGRVEGLAGRLEGLDGRIEGIEGRVQRQVTRLILWIVPAIFGGLAAFGTIVAAFD